MDVFFFSAFHFDSIEYVIQKLFKKKKKQQCQSSVLSFPLFSKQTQSFCLSLSLSFFLSVFLSFFPSLEPAVCVNEQLANAVCFVAQISPRTPLHAKSTLPRVRSRARSPEREAKSCVHSQQSVSIRKKRQKRQREK